MYRIFFKLGGYQVNGKAFYVVTKVCMFHTKYLFAVHNKGNDFAILSKRKFWAGQVINPAKTLREAGLIF